MFTKELHILAFQGPKARYKPKKLDAKTRLHKIKKIWDSHSHLRMNVERAVAVCVRLRSLFGSVLSRGWEWDRGNSHWASEPAMRDAQPYHKY